MKGLVKFCLLAVLGLVFGLDLRGADSPPVPLLVEGNMMQVPVQAFGRTLYFIVDTGFTISAIDLNYQAELGNPIDIYTAVSPLGVKKDVVIYRCPELSLAGRSLDLDKIVGLDLKMLRSITGRPCDGILGMDWFAKNIVAIDFDDRTFSVVGAVPDRVKSAFVPVALTQSNDYYTMPVLVNRTLRLDLMIDTGDSSSLSLNQGDWRAVFANRPMKTVRATMADAVNQVAQTRIGAVGPLSVQGLNYASLHATLIRKPHQASRLGLGFFQRHNVTFDFGGRMLYLQPGRNFATPDIEDMSGLHLLRHGQFTTVYSVDQHSPATDQGIRAGDVIETVADRPAAGLTMEVIRQILRSGDGTQVALQIRRGGKLMAVRITLKKAL